MTESQGPFSLPISRKKSPHPALALFFVLTCALGYFVTNIVYPVIPLWIYQILFFFLPATIAIHFSFENKKEDLYASKLSLKTVILFLILAVLVSLALNLLTLAWNKIITLPESYVEYYNALLASQTKVDMLLMIFTLGLFPAIFEETLFRGYLQNVLKRAWGIKISILVTSLVFTLCHLNPWYAPLYFILGIFLGWCQHYRNHLALPILAHWVNNMVALLIFKMT